MEVDDDGRCGIRRESQVDVARVYERVRRGAETVVDGLFEAPGERGREGDWRSSETTGAESHWKESEHYCEHNSRPEERLVLSRGYFEYGSSKLHFGGKVDHREDGWNEKEQDTRNSKL